VSANVIYSDSEAVFYGILDLLGKLVFGFATLWEQVITITLSTKPCFSIYTIKQQEQQEQQAFHIVFYTSIAKPLSLSFTSSRFFPLI
jgi:bacteriorhodopsin